MKKHPSVKDIVRFKAEGPWTTKSNGLLRVLFSLDNEQLQEFTDGSNAQRGIRIYAVEGLAKGAIGANEWHKIRTEIVSCTTGSLLWDFTDTDGKVRQITLKPNHSILIPPYILHCYTALQPRTSLHVLANTYFIPNKPLTHDTYSAEDFTNIINS